MAKATQTIVTITSDVTGDEATNDAVKSYRLRGQVDAGPDGVAKLTAALKRLGVADLVSFVEVGEVKPAGASQGDLSAVREWARANGHEVADRGRIADEIHEAYRKATSAKAGV